MYRFEFHEDPGYLEAELAGFWSLDELKGFDRAINHYVAKYAARFPQFPMLSDSRDFAVQSAEVSEAFAACSSAGAERHSGRVAIVVKSALSRMQTARFTDKNWTRRFFDDMDEARAWVVEDARARADARRRHG
jgi:hypothetical protein